MKRCEVWWVHFDLSFGGEIKKKRSAVIVRHDNPTKFLDRIQIVSLTGKTDRLYPGGGICLMVECKESKAMAYHEINKLRPFNVSSCLRGEW